MFISGGSYYINRAGGGLISEVISGRNIQTSLVPIAPETIPGVFTCGADSGCENSYTILLKEDRTVEMTRPVYIDSKDDENNDGGETESEEVEVISSEENAVATADTSTTTTTVAQDETQAASATDQEEPSMNKAVTLSDDTTSENINKKSSKTAKSEESSEKLTFIIDKGTWTLGVQNMLVLTFNEYGTSTYNIPQKLVVKDVGISTLSKISFTKTNYTNMTNPVFTKQE